MITNKEGLKAKLRNLSDETNIASNYLLQSFMFEGLLKRISNSKYREKFIIKGGMLLTSIFGINLRSTMDLDATLKGLTLNIETITSIFNELINMNIDDNMTFEIIDIREIREEDLYGGYCINLKATFDKLWTHLMIDITTGDIITYKEIEFKYRTLFDDEIINILSYNYETIIAEKFESIISRNINNSRMKDYYDLYMFTSLKWNRINKSILFQAIVNTCKNRRTIDFINNSNSYIEMITNDDKLKKLWKSYQEKYEYVKEITFEDCINAIKIINEVMIPISV